MFSDFYFGDHKTQLSRCIKMYFFKCISVPYRPFFRRKKTLYSENIINVRNLEVKTKLVCLLSVATR